MTAVAVLIFGAILKCLPDMVVQRIVFVGLCISHILLIFFSDSSDIVTYVAVILFVSCLSGWGNLTFLLSELRAPP